MTLDPDSILDGWHGWDTPPKSCPVIVCELGGGRSNRSFLLESTDGKMVLRINAANFTLPGIKRHQEAETWRAACEAGIAPPLLHADPSGRFLVSAYVESDLPAHPRDDPALATRALELLQRTHQLGVNAPVIDYAAHIRAYWQHIEAHQDPVVAGLREQREPMRQCLAALLDSQTQITLCHHDPVVENFVGSPDRLYLLDWEYAVRGLAVIDYAAFGIEWGVDDAVITACAGTEPALLTASKTLYRYLCDLWEAAKTR